MPTKKAFLHALKLYYPYQNQLDQLSATFGDDFELIWRALEKQGKVYGKPEKQFTNLNALGIKTVALSDPDYPLLLKQIFDPPALLYYRGILPTNQLHIAVVGSRKASSYGLRVVEELIHPLRGQNLTIVSGLAYGIDTQAHLTALDSQLSTLAVLGSGLDYESIYPKENRELSQKIISAGGTLLSELPPGTKGLPAHFPMRNRIISGISTATVIIEAGRKSGALITGRLALEQNRDIFAVPGNIFEESSEGTNQLIKLGAKAITSADDLLKEYDLNKMNLKLPSVEHNLSKDEMLLLKHLAKKAKSLNSIVAETTLPLSAVNSLLTTLEIKGFIKALPDDKYSLNLTGHYNSG
ncbi:MAG: DNA-processing protein DprA [Candidatus Doudnabacteria bacterium]